MRGWVAAIGALVLHGIAHAGTYAAVARWRPAADAGVVGYRLYLRVPGGPFALALDAGLPSPAADGTLAATLRGLDVCTAHGVVVRSYRGDGGESPSSNEIVLGYAQVASRIDTDGDGLSNAAEDVDLDCIVDAGETDPQRADTDGDGVLDPRDVCRGTAARVAVDASGCSCTQLRCDDGNPCTTDGCSAAVACTHTAVAGCTACTSVAGCDDRNPCTTDACSAGRCTHGAVADGTTCGDGNACNGRETCRSGACQPGVALACDDGNACTVDGCSGTTGCTHAPVTGCTACTTAATCDDRNACTADACTAGRCAHAAVTDGTSCEDGAFCNGAETCRAGTCAPGTAVACDDTSACTADACDEVARRCTHAAVPDCCTSDAECAGGDACHTNARCEAGRCASDPVVCPDAGACATASCDPATGCTTTPLPDGAACDDGDPCTLDDACVAGACGSTTALAVVGDSGVPRTRLTMRTGARGLVVSANAWLPTAIDARSTDVRIELLDEGGALLLEREVPARLFVPRDGGARYRDDRRDAGGGFTAIDLRARSDRTVMTLRAVVPPAKDAAAELDLAPLRSGDAASATLTWRVRANDRCLKGSGECRGHGRRCRS